MGISVSTFWGFFFLNVCYWFDMAKVSGFSFRRSPCVKDICYDSYLNRVKRQASAANCESQSVSKSHGWMDRGGGLVCL